MEFKLKVELEFLDSTKCRIHEEHMEYDYAIPAPNVGDRVCVEGNIHEVEKRDFIYLSGEKGFPDLKISIWVK